MSTINEHNKDTDLERVAPTLHAMKGRRPLVVPDGFYDRFPHAVVARITKEEARGSGTIWWRVLVPTVPVLAAIAAMLWYTTGTAPTPTQEPLSLLTLAELDAYSPLDEHVLLAEIEELPEWDQVDAELSQDELLAYLEHSDLELYEVLPYLE